MGYVLRVVGFANGNECPFADQFLEWYRPNAPESDALAGFTDDLDKAERFPDVQAVHETWRAVRLVDPVRPDGKPNRPLTAFTVTIEKVKE